jgi:hypothetical protein
MLSFRGAVVLVSIAIGALIAILLIDIIAAAGLVNAYNAGDDEFKDKYRHVYVASGISLAINLVIIVGVMITMFVLRPYVVGGWDGARAAYATWMQQAIGGDSSTNLRDWKVLTDVAMTRKIGSDANQTKLADLIVRRWTDIKGAYTKLKDRPGYTLFDDWTRKVNNAPKVGDVKQMLE